MTVTIKTPENVHIIDLGDFRQQTTWIVSNNEKFISTKFFNENSWSGSGEEVENMNYWNRDRQWMNDGQDVL